MEHAKLSGCCHYRKRRKHPLLTYSPNEGLPYLQQVTLFTKNCFDICTHINLHLTVRLWYFVS
ncbi:hypothetical protein C0J52_10277 [Blattella germanica]|nr:hypothetical protein C0J52_10277 [Blattella germanica]